MRHSQERDAKQIIRFLRLEFRGKVCKVIDIWEVPADRWFFKL